MLIAVLVVLLVSSTFVLMGNSLVIKNPITAQPLSTDALYGDVSKYGDLSQYEWPMMAQNENQDSFSAGPGPNRPDVAWKATVTGGSGYVCVFNGKAFALAGTTVRAFDAYTGTSVWNATLLGSAAGTGGVTKIDEQYFFATVRGVEIHKISDGSFVSNLTLSYYSGLPGSAQYFPGAYSSTLKMKYVLSYDPIQKKGFCNAISVADPLNPRIAWTFTCEEVSEIMSYGYGKVFLGTTQGTVYTLNAATGEFIWKAPKTGVAQQSGFCYDGKFYQAASSQVMSAYDAETGTPLWEYDSLILGERGYFAYRGAAGYGRVYDASDSIDPNGWILCWDANKGDVLWKQPGYFNIHYATMALADGKLYGITCDRAPGAVTAGLTMPGFSFTCFDAFTGTQLWTIPNLQFATPTIAYGNLYGIYNNVLYCIGQSPSPKSWAFGFSGNLETPRLATGQSGPANLSYPRWVFQTGGKVGSSAAAVNGKIYIGSDDQNIYCLNAYTGTKIWSFATEHKVESCVAVLNNRVYTGSDDGNVYCLDANTGSQIWKTPTGGLVLHVLMPQELQQRSSPIIVGDNLYVGAMDGKLYCLNPSNGQVRWTYTTQGPIGGSPVYNNGVIYITSTDTYLYAINSADGTLKWKSIPLNLDAGIAGGSQFFNTGTPAVANGVVYIECGVPFGLLTPTEKYRWLTNGVGPGYTNPGGANGGALRFAAFNAATGASIWNQTMVGNSGCVWMPVYKDGLLYVVEYLQVTAMNATKPNSGPVNVTGYQQQPGGGRMWKQWVGYQILSSVCYADDIRGAKIYVGSDVGSVTCLNATSGAPISAYQSGGNIESSPTVWDGKLYIGGVDRNVYCFDDSPIVDFGLWAAASKGTEMWNNETLTVGGQLTGNPNEMTWEGTVYIPVPSDMHPGIPNATVIVSFIKPDGSVVNMTTKTDNLGKFSLTYSPTETGNWGWLAYYEGQRTPAITYNSAFTDVSSLNVVTPTGGSNPNPSANVTPQATASPQATATPTTNNAFPMEYVYAIVAVIVIAVIAVVAYIYLKGSKKPTQ